MSLHANRLTGAIPMELGRLTGTLPWVFWEPVHWVSSDPAVATVIGEGDFADIEITLPVIVGELCQGNRTIRGIVEGPTGDPAAVWVGPFNRWNWTGEDGLSKAYAETKLLRMVTVAIRLSTEYH